MKKNDQNNNPPEQASLADLLGSSMDPVTEAPTTMVARCIKLFHSPVEEFTPDDLRLMIVQGFGLPYLIPKALDILKKDLFTEVLYYSGDLLEAVIHTPIQFWEGHSLLQKELIEIVRGKEKALQQHNMDIPDHLR